MADNFKVTIRGSACTIYGACRPRNTVNQLYEKFKNETNITTKRTFRIMKNRKTEDLGEEFENLCKQRRDARLAYIRYRGKLRRGKLLVTRKIFREFSPMKVSPSYI